MNPIALNEFGETLLEYPNSKSADDRNILCVIDGRIVEVCIGIHDLCRGWVDAKPISKTHNALCCRRCNLRIVIPSEVNTFGKLRQWCAANLAEREETRERFHKLVDQHAVYGPLPDSNLLEQPADGKPRDVQADAHFEARDALEDLS